MVGGGQVGGGCAGCSKHTSRGGRKTLRAGQQALTAATGGACLTSTTWPARTVTQPWLLAWLCTREPWPCFLHGWAVAGQASRRVSRHTGPQGCLLGTFLEWLPLATPGAWIAGELEYMLCCACCCPLRCWPPSLHPGPHPPILLGQPHQQMTIISKSSFSSTWGTQGGEGRESGNTLSTGHKHGTVPR